MLFCCVQLAKKLLQIVQMHPVYVLCVPDISKVLTIRSVIVQVKCVDRLKFRFSYITRFYLAVT